jgi:hypothetical protein
MARIRAKKPGLSLREIVGAAQAREDARAVAEGLAETARLERARGGQVEQAQGRMRITSRDGLLTLHERGGLERPEYEAGAPFSPGSRPSKRRSAPRRSAWCWAWHRRTAAADGGAGRLRRRRRRTGSGWRAAPQAVVKSAPRPRLGGFFAFAAIAPYRAAARCPVN